MSIMGTAGWIKENHVTVVDWLISIAAIAIPLIISRLDNHKIVSRKNLFRGYISFIIKATFYQFALLWIFWGAGSILCIPQDIEWLNKKTYLLSCIVASGVCSVFSGFNWVNHLNLLKKGGKLGGLCTIILAIMPIILQSVTYIVAVGKSVPSRHWILIWALLNFLIILAALFIVSDHDFFEHQNIALILEDGGKYEVEPETLHIAGDWLTVDGNADGVTTGFQKKRIQRIEYSSAGRNKSEKAIGFKSKLLYSAVCLCYLVTIGVASQFLLRTALTPIFVAEGKIYLAQGDHYQIAAVALDPDAGVLRYNVSDSAVISVTEDGTVSVNGGLAEGESITTQVTIADEAGNTATVQVAVTG